MKGFGIALTIIAMVTLASTSGMFSSPNNANPSYNGGKTYKRNKHRRKKTSRSAK